MDSATGDTWLGYECSPSSNDYFGSHHNPIPPRIPLLAAENFSFNAIPCSRNEYHYDDYKLRVQDILHRNCSVVYELASPFDPTLRSMSSELASKIAADLETRLSMTAQRRKRCSWNLAYYTYSQRDDGHDIDPLDKWIIDILVWIGWPEPTTSEADQNDSDSNYDEVPNDYSDRADEIAPSFDSLLLFVAHHVKAYLSERVAAGPLKAEDCRLILPIANEEEGDHYIYRGEYDYYKSFGYTECGMFPLSCSVDRQAVLAHHCIVADIEIAAYEDELDGAHNRRFVWGLTTSSRTIHAYVFGPDGIWASTAMDISGAEGRLAFISLLVNWSLCPVDRFGFDPTVRYVLGKTAGDTYLEIDVHETDKDTGLVEKLTYYSKQCVGAAERLFGPHARYFAASNSLESMDKPTFLIKDMWSTLSSDTVDDTHESSFLNVLHAEFGQSSEFGSSFSQFVNTGPVYINRGDTVVVDSTATAFAGLPDISQIRQHGRTMTKWAGKMISAADNPSQVVIAIADAMCKILHGNLSDRAIQFQETTDGIKGTLGEFDYASYSGDGTGKVPEILLFQSIRNLERLVEPGARGMRSREHAQAPNTRLDDWESILYVICILGTLGINKMERDTCAQGDSDYPRIKTWSTNHPHSASRHKRDFMSSSRSFNSCITRCIRHEPLRRLAEDIHRVLFLHPECQDATESLEGVDPLVLRDAFEEDIVEELLCVVERHKQLALVTLSTTEATPTTEAEPIASPSKKRKRKVVPTTTPMMTRSRASRSLPKV
ncbi:hypothetical protein GGI09_007107 [Coemansia sp. S100]|nr:hypothetical protein GGI09_007107 [Coemansia sp. S100]KAJ2099707.1 hypothetical protein GGI16_003917 [Coemansia sp. S142-1]